MLKISLKKSIIVFIAFSLMFVCACGSETGTSGQETDTDLTVSVDESEIDTGLSSNCVDFTVSDLYTSMKTSDEYSTNSLVFYEIFVGSFSDSDGDGTGDIRGIINRMDYLNDGDIESGESLGIEGIWLSPIFKSPSYHKYDVANYYEIDPKFGTMDDLKELVDLCHERGVKIILDMVINHTSSDNKWFQEFKKAHRAGDTESEYYNYYTYSDTNSGGGKTYYKITDTSEYYEGNFSGDMPELDYDNEAVREKVIEIADYYLTDIGVDGFRFDAAKYIYYGEQEKNVDFWIWYIDELKKIKPDVYTVAEVWDADSLTDKYEVALNCFNFTMSQVGGLISETAQKGSVERYTSYVEQYITRVKSYNKDATIIPFIANHDMDRAAGFLNMISGNAKIAANLYLLGPGSPFIYYGEEVGLKGSRGAANTDANRRLAMRWGDGDKVRNPEGTTFEDKKQTNPTVIEQLDDETSLYNYYKKLIMLRRANPEIYLGDYKALPEAGTTGVSGFVATYEDLSVYVIHNTQTKTVSVKLSDLGITTDGKLSVTEYIGSGILDDGLVQAVLDNDTLTITGQTSVILR